MALVYIIINLFCCTKNVLVLFLSGVLRSAYFVQHVQKLRTCLQIRTTKAEWFAVETHHFKIQHVEITVEGMASSE